VVRQAEGAVVDTPRKVARITRGPTNACIDFHCDGSNASSTMQIALNDPTEYEGGRLVFGVNNNLHVLERPAGSVVLHPPNVLHAVSALTAGKRQSLFVVDYDNGLGETGVIVATMQHVQDFVESKRPKVPYCIICLENIANHAPYQCLQMSFCVATVLKILVVRAQFAAEG